MGATKPSQAKDPYLAPSFAIGNRLRRLVWSVAYNVLFRTSPTPLHKWRAMLLRAFGARIGRDCHIYPKARIWAPWNLKCGEVAAIADDAIVYNPSSVTLGPYSIVSQQAYLCGATHDYEDPTFPLIAFPISIGAHAWICARATVMPGVSVGEGAVLALGAVAARNLDAWTIYGGVPAVKLKRRVREDGRSS